MRNNAIIFNDPLGDTVKLNGDKDAIAPFIAMLNSTTGNTYENKDGILTRTNKKLNTKSSKTVSGGNSSKADPHWPFIFTFKSGWRKGVNTCGFSMQPYYLSHPLLIRTDNNESPLK